MSQDQNIDMSVDLTEAILWEYGQAESLLSLVKSKNAWYQTNQVQFWNNWIRDVFDIRTANQFGLIIWSIILNIPLHIAVAPTPAKNVFGFGTYNKNFNWGSFGTITPTVVTLSIEYQRILLLLRYNQLTGKCSVPFINRMLKNILGSYGLIYVTDPLDMTTMVYTVKFTPSSELWFILTECNVLPRPAGMAIDVVIA